jgi:23S rRNA-/tRNA-specific pseudouridylate synthase
MNRIIIKMKSNDNDNSKNDETNGNFKVIQSVYGTIKIFPKRNKIIKKDVVSNHNKYNGLKERYRVKKRIQKNYSSNDFEKIKNRDENNNEDYFGLEKKEIDNEEISTAMSSQPISQKSKDSLDYIDKQMFGDNLSNILNETKQSDENNVNKIVILPEEPFDYSKIPERLRIIDNKSNQSPQNDSNLDKSEELGYVDDLYFSSISKNSSRIEKNDPKLEYPNKTTSSPPSPTTITEKSYKKDLEDIKDFNYIDEVVFKHNESDDINLGSLKNFIKPKTKSNFRKNKIETEIPLMSKEITTDDYDDSLLKKKMRQVTMSMKNNKDDEDQTKQKDNSQHKIIAAEVPKWNNLTISEAVIILKNHVCYFNEENGILAIDKPYGLPCFGGPGVHLCISRLLPQLKASLQLNETSQLYMAHRLDENTTGILLFATNKEKIQQLREMFNERKIFKQYLAITKNRPKHNDGEINIPLIRRSIGGIVKVIVEIIENKTLIIHFI